MFVLLLSNGEPVSGKRSLPDGVASQKTNFARSLCYQRFARIRPGEIDRESRGPSGERIQLACEYFRLLRGGHSVCQSRGRTGMSNLQ